MPRKLPPYVEANRTRHGKVLLYFRIGKGPRIRLPDDPNSEEFAEAYRAALAGNYTAPAQKASKIVPGSIASVIRSYRNSADYKALRETTKKGYASRLRFIDEKHGHRLMAGLTHERIRKAFLDPHVDKPGAAISYLKMLRILIRHAIGMGILKHDPSIAIKRPKGGTIRSWTEAEIDQFLGYWPRGTKQRLAFILFLYTGQRRSDVHRMTWNHISGDKISVVQQKTGTRLDIPIHPVLADELAAAPRKHLSILTTAYGKAFTVDGFSGFMRDAISEAGLPLDCQPHGLRKAAGRRLAEAECTAHEIMSVLGLKTLAEAERYTREANMKRLASSAMRKLDGRNEN